VPVTEANLYAYVKITAIGDLNQIMKKIKYLLASLTLVLPLLAVTLVSAEEAKVRTTTAETTAPEPKRELSTQDKAVLKQQLEKRKAAMKVKLSNAEKQRLQARCKNSQGMASNLKGKINGVETSRSHVHENMVARLIKLSEKLNKQGVDTAALDAEIVALQEKIITFKADLEEYKTAVAELRDMDCAQDPEAFKASLEAARAAREKISVDVKGIRTYVNDAVKPTLKDLRSKLAEDKTTEGNQ
jgi:chromosome segregation ATPase